MPGFQLLVYFSSLGSDGRETAGKVSTQREKSRSEPWVPFIYISFLLFFSQNGKVKSSFSSLVCCSRCTQAPLTPVVLVSWLSTTFVPCDWIIRSLINYSWLAIVILVGRKKNMAPVGLSHSVSWMLPSSIPFTVPVKLRTSSLKVFCFLGGFLKTSFSEHTLKTPQRWTVGIMVKFVLFLFFIEMQFWSSVH